MSWIRERKDITLEEMCGKLERELGVKLTVSTLSYHIRRMGYSVKKTLKASEQGRDDIVAMRRWWQQLAAAG